jgi:YD repeat-containing protein
MPPPPLRPLLVIVAVSLTALSAGCTTARVTATERSSVEQRLLVRSLERAAVRFDTAPLMGHRVRIDLFTLTKDQLFAREFLRARLESRGVRFAGPGDDADVTIQVFTAALAVDTADTLVGLPAMQAPILAVPIPEIALFKLERSRGHAEVQTYTYDGTGRLITRLRDAKGEARYNRVTLLIFISFAVTDIDKQPVEP